MILRPIMRLAGLVFRIGDRFGFTRICEASASFQDSIIRNCPHPEPKVIGNLKADGSVVKECRLCGVGIIEPQREK
jgi:hypothetical protein